MNNVVRIPTGVKIEHAIVFKFQVSPELITLQRIMTVQDADPVIGRVTSVHLDNMRSRAEWKDGCSWFFQFNSSIGETNNLTFSNDRVLMKNYTAETFASKCLGGRYPFQGWAVQPYGIMYVPFCDADFTEMSYQLLLPATGYTYESNLEFTELKNGFWDIDLPGLERFPTMTIDAPDTITHDKYVQGKVQVLWQGKPLSGHTVEVCLDALAGYLPKQRLVVGSEPEFFRIGALGLQAGDKILLRAGFKYRSSIAEKLITVV